MAGEQKQIFLSHSYHDKDLADRLVILLTNGCDVSPNDILCTSLSGMNIEVGTSSFVSYLKEQLENPSLVIVLASENYLLSPFCLAELGATWRMGLPCFPLAVPPRSRNGIGGVLELVQAGDVTDGRYLDQLRDAVFKYLKKQVPTDGWNYRKDVFLNRIHDVITAIKMPDHVSRAELEKTQGQYRTALNDIGAKDLEVKKLKEQIAALEIRVPKEQIKEVVAEFTTGSQQFDRYQNQAGTALKRLKSATRTALYWRARGERYIPKGDDEWNDVETARAVEEIEIQEGEKTLVIANDGHPRVEAANDALLNLQEFLDDDKNYYFIHELTDNYHFPISLKNKDFWRNFLVNV